MEELEIKVIDACRKYVKEKGNSKSYVGIKYDKNGTLIKCVKSFYTPLVLVWLAGEDVFGTIIMKEGKIEKINSMQDINFSDYILKEVGIKK